MKEYINKDADTKLTFGVSLLSNWYFLAGGLFCIIAKFAFKWPTLILGILLLVAWVGVSIFTTGMIKHASENQGSSKERANVNPYSKKSSDFVKVEKPEENAAEAAAEAVSKKAEEVEAAVKPDKGEDKEVTPESLGLELEGQSELDKALEAGLEPEEVKEEIPELKVN